MNTPTAGAATKADTAVTADCPGSLKALRMMGSIRVPMNSRMPNSMRKVTSQPAMVTVIRVEPARLIASPPTSGLSTWAGPTWKITITEKIRDR